MENTNIKELTLEEQFGRPYFLRKIYYNRITFYNQEKQLYKFSKDLQSRVMVDFYPLRPICMSHNLNEFEEYDQ